MNEFSCTAFTTAWYPLWSGGEGSSVWLFSNNQMVYYCSIPVASGMQYELVIEDLGSSEINLKTPITVTLIDLGAEVIAEFREAEISVSEDTASDALQWLKESIADTYITFKKQRHRLGPLPMRQLRVLEEYLVEDQKG
jgi:hypothetical protein